MYTLRMTMIGPLLCALAPSVLHGDQKRDVEIKRELPEINRINNGDFEAGFGMDGLADGWSAHVLRPGGYFKENAKLGPIGGGIYGARTKHESGDWNADVQTIRLAGKTNLVDVAREDVIGKLREALGDDVIVVAKYNVEAWFHEKGQEVLKGDPVQQGREFADYCAERVEKTGFRANCYYGLNEPNVNSAEDFAKICAFEKAFTLRLHQHGLRSIVINHSTGTPADRRNMLLEPVRDLLEIADYVGYHCYGGPKDELMCAPSSTALSMRWRTFARWYAERGWRFPPMIYTESSTWGGWHDNFGRQLVADDVKMMADRIANEPWSIGMCLFCTGCWNGQIWCKWDFSEFPDMIEQLRAYNLAHPVDARSGTKSQQIGSRSDKPFGNAICQAFPSRPNSNMRVTLWVKHEFYDGFPHRTRVHVGIDRTGQTKDPRASSIEWSEELIEKNRWESDIWYFHSTDFGPTNETSSIWIKVEKPAGPPARVSIDDIKAVETP